MRIGLMGGTFDPVHFGHLKAAKDARKQQRLDQVIFLPAAESPAKPRTTAAANFHRVAMLREAVAGNSRYRVSEFEITQGGASFTINTVSHFRREFPNAQLFWIMGADKLASLDHWRSIEDLAQIVEFIVLERPGTPPSSRPHTPGLKLHPCRGQLINVSSSEIRDSLSQGRQLTDLIPPKTIVYILKHGLYV